MRMRTITPDWIKTHLMKLGLASAMLVAPAIALPQIAAAQSPTTSESTAGESTTEPSAEASSDLSEYSPETAPLLYEGRSGEAVRTVQAFLQRQDFYNGVVDGVYGPRTVSSIITFQRSRNLSADGIVGENTWEALLDAYDRTSPDVGEDAITDYDPETAPILAYGVRGPAVEAVQAFLKANNYYSGAVDGIFGSSTRAAVIAFQEPYVGLEADGIVGESTWDAFIDVATAKG